MATVEEMNEGHEVHGAEDSDDLVHVEGMVELQTER